MAQRSRIVINLSIDIDWKRNVENFQDFPTTLYYNLIHLEIYIFLIFEEIKDIEIFLQVK